ncbi:hypothetical protein BBO99_00009157 [Phytophthora kernoviae]|uniref:Myb/SANT-like domain-containing protein n=2 Tax=Phytophthora kernoviae TaxID=325452 RepID=A0A3F2RCV7_9STRA|nr:hypothetical protein G195_010726 [Phytophthora kernoviae 00238/432]KAG2507312.1 hypothetical protein JM16_009022 [Phytophthora kernoviae]KAG2509826.1 hypothetical protein JM18_009059 [Phytophthora kernoviae]RLN26723.1 hypothetical protein BBI17_009177 [Phytophthora kernoviae]RLN53339.1 hypothetical protein BBP00_00009347 [Phytophthora kernoviae]
MAEDEGITPANTGIGTSTTKQSGRGRYAKFSSEMDMLLLDALQEFNPFTAKHGTRLQMWQNIAEKLGMQVYKNPAMYSWHTCRDRVSALMKMYADGKHDKLFKNGNMEENSRKESILRDIDAVLARKNHKMALRNLADANGMDRAPEMKVAVAQKRRKVDNVGASSLKIAASSDVHDANSSDNFRTRVLELIESKIQFDMDQRVKETELREQEFELQKRFLEYLQSK